MAETDNDDRELQGVPVDGELYRVDDLNGREQRELRRVLRELTENETGTLNHFLNFGLIDDFDLACGITYVIRQRADKSYTLDQALELNPSEVADEARKLMKQKTSRRRPPKPASSSES